MAKFILGKESEDQSKKSIKSLLSYIKKEKGANHVEPVYLIIDTLKPLAKTNDHIPRVIPITNKLAKVTDKSILLITKDPSTPYRKPLTDKNSPTEDYFNEIITLTRLKSIAKNGKNLKKLFIDYDIIVADNRVMKFLPTILGTQFYLKNKKLPFMVQMAKPDPDAVLTKGKKSTKLKDDRCEPLYVKQQIKSIVRNTFFVPSKGTCLSVRIGNTDFTPEQLITNINEVLDYLISSKYQPIGGLIKNVKNLHSIHIKTAESISLPIKQHQPDKDEGNESD